MACCPGRPIRIFFALGRHHCITAPLHHRATAPQHNSTTAQQHNSTTAQQHHSTTAPPRNGATVQLPRSMGKHHEPPRRPALCIALYPARPAMQLRDNPARRQTHPRYTPALKWRHRIQHAISRSALCKTGPSPSR
ncbi:hypothetical protein FX016_12325 [Cupriavidus gilardii]|nr:hypothetical protein FX016_12325 [Cupriavidus gilardii]